MMSNFFILKSKSSFSYAYYIAEIKVPNSFTSLKLSIYLDAIHVHIITCISLISERNHILTLI